MICSTTFHHKKGSFRNVYLTEKDKKPHVSSAQFKYSDMKISWDIIISQCQFLQFLKTTCSCDFNMITLITIWQLDFKKLKQTLDLCILYTRNNLKIWTTLCQVFFYKCKYCMMIFLTIKQFLLRWAPPSFDATNNNWLKISFSIFAGGMKVQTLNHYIAIFPSNTGIS